MNGLLDTNTLIDHLNGVPDARTDIMRYSTRAISIVTWIEVMVGARDELKASTLSFLSTFSVIGLNIDIAERAVELRRDHRLKLPDAVTWASAQVSGFLLVTRNTRDFPRGDPGIRMPYSVNRLV